MGNIEFKTLEQGETYSFFYNSNEEVLDEFTEALLSSDELKAEKILLAVTGEHLDARMLDSLIIPAFTRIGQSWNDGDAALSQVYFSGKIVNNILKKHNSLYANKNNSSGLKIAVGLFQDPHVLGKDIVSQLLVASGYQIIDLGILYSVEELVEATERERPDVLMLSMLMLRSALNIAQVKPALAQKNLSPIIVVGGAPFRFDPSLAEEVGADYAGSSASDALSIMEEIAQKKKTGGLQ